MVAIVADKNCGRCTYKDQLKFMFDQRQLCGSDEQIDIVIEAVAGWCLTMLKIGYIDTKQMVAINDMIINNEELDLEILGL